MFVRLFDAVLVLSLLVALVPMTLHQDCMEELNAVYESCPFRSHGLSSKAVL